MERNIRKVSREQVGRLPAAGVTRRICVRALARKTVGVAMGRKIWSGRWQALSEEVGILSSVANLASELASEAMQR